MSENRSEMFFVGALITSALGGILVLATRLAGFDGSNYYLGVLLYGGIGAFSGVYSILILLAGFLLIYCMIISILVLKFPEKIPDRKYVKYGLYASAGAFILTIINGIIFAVVATDEEWWWWFEAGFYGGVIGGLLTAIFYYMGEKELVLP
ncbi:hypothetical protein LCGC14_0688560 [marine sediment metagenome]|uniref:Uncharacterized protein n=1 Tax=marine sediment metagenome TaxID=412755 RepID=A0A0F9T7F7_9ZZZZ|nr:MAG: hypothetical protein Lokiarch_35180 [Candidatus Lokiarchaeum sp. GC14_75]